MAVQEVELLEVSQQRYLTYALSVVSGRALPDVRDGLKPVQRRILFAMYQNLRLSPEKPHRKSAAVVGEVLARYHPHGDSACYDAMVRMAQDFSLRYPLVDGQGNFGSLDGDSAAAYRYTEARLTSLALEVIGDIGQETIEERDNFDQTVKEPVVLPSRVPNLLINGAAGIAVGLATAIPPHNLTEVIKGLQLLLEDREANDAKLFNAVKGPDFPTGCLILNSKAELREIYRTGRGAIRMRGSHIVEHKGRAKYQIVVQSIPYNVDKSVLVEKIAELIIAKKVPQLVDVRDESTGEIRVVMELAHQADADTALAYLYKHTSLESNFNVNMTALVPTDNPYAGRPAQLSLREMLLHFIDFRYEVTRRKLTFEKGKLEERIHLLEGLVSVFDAINEVIQIVRKSSGRADAAARLVKRFKLTEVQALFIVDLRIYQLSKTSIDELTSELEEKSARVAEIDKILKSKKRMTDLLSEDLSRVEKEYGDERRSKIEHDFEEVELDTDAYVRHEDSFVVVTKDGWIKRIKQSNDPSSTRVRDGDALFFVGEASTKDYLALYTSHGNVFVLRVYDLMSTSGYGEPVQKRFKFQDGEQIVACECLDEDGTPEGEEVLLYSEGGYGLRLPHDAVQETKRNGKRLMRLGKGDRMCGMFVVEKDLAITVTEQGYVVCFHTSEVPLLSGAGKGVILQKLPKGDRVRAGFSIEKKSKVRVQAEKAIKEVDVSSMTITGRAKRGLKLVKRGLPVVGHEIVIPKAEK
ncbi:MAG: DNA topoisomerase IV subunit A [Bdellovibrionales bacterium]|nr:DNA topoisomerase IV subunit A [Bdellovibrionales bacterium]